MIKKYLCPKCTTDSIEIKIESHETTMMSDNKESFIFTAEIFCDNCNTRFDCLKPMDFTDEFQILHYAEHCIKTNLLFEKTKYCTHAFYKTPCERF